ncbi:MAG: tetratricopeptide repeat protein, partial [Candidatus Lambdaproteobacteria bacterium]|nr:tetratricopeptide repeat protein [Candidatus Lambdaproteobacteria bacterium]
MIAPRRPSPPVVPGILARCSRRGVGAAGVLALALALAGSLPGPLGAQRDAAPSVAEIRQAQAVRAQGQGGKPLELVQAAQAYLKAFPAGKYTDEILLALAGGLAATGDPAGALAAYDRLIEGFAESPFREEALVRSLPLLQQGQPQQADARLEQLVTGYPRSIHKAAALLWQAQLRLAAEDAAGTLHALNRIDPGMTLAAGERTTYLRLAGWAHLKQGQRDKALSFFQGYIGREDTAENRTPVLMTLGRLAREQERWEEALGYYEQAVERGPLPAYLAEARYWRAAMFNQARVHDPPHPAAVTQAIALYDGYLAGGDTQYRPLALRQRARLFDLGGWKGDALKDYEELAKAAPFARDPAILRARARLMADVQREPEAVALLRSGLADRTLSPPARTEIVLQLAAIYYRQENCADVLKLMEPLPGFTEPDLRRKAVFMRGFCLYRAGQWERASWDLEALVREREYFNPVWSALLDAYERSGQYARLVNLTEELLTNRQIAGSDDVFDRLARAYGALGQPQQLIEAYGRLDVIQPGVLETAAVQYRLGTAEEAVGRVPVAMQHYEKALAFLLAKPAADQGPSARAAAGAGQPAAGAVAAAPLGGTLAPLAPAERIHAILINQSRYAEAAALDDRAAPLARTPQDQARLTALRRETAFEWGTSELRADHPAAAAEQLGLAWGFAAAEPPAQRTQVLTPLGQALVQTGAFDQAAQHYRQTLTLALEPPLKARLQEELRGILVTWAEREEQEHRPRHAEPLYEETMALLPAGERAERQRLAAKLDGLYDARKAFATRIALFEGLAAAIPDPELAEKLRLYRSRIYLAWGQSEAAGKALDSALKQFRAGLKLLKPAEWRQRHELTAALGEALLQRKQYEPLVAAYQELLGSIDDPKFQAQVRGFLGQIYVEWGKAAQARKD